MTDKFDPRITEQADLPGELNEDPNLLDETFVLLGAEGCSELGDPWPVWVRYAEPDELEDWKTERLRAMGSIRLGPSGLQDAARRVSDLCVDGTGRPYYLVAVRADAPANIWELAQKKLRTLRLKG